MLANGWVITIIGLIVPLTNGGAAGAIWSYVLAIIGSFFSTLSMAEMASMAPTA
jgi:choline transport protein